MRIPKPKMWPQGHDILSKIKRVYTKGALPPPPISQSTAVLLVLSFTVLYVAPFYLSPSLRTSSRLARDDPKSIRARTRSVYLTCAITTCIALYSLTAIGHLPLHDVFILLGLWPVDFESTLHVQGLLAILFAGPLFEHIIIHSTWRTLSWRHLHACLWTDWIGYRNLIVGPISEELIFRSLATALFLLSHCPPSRIVYLSPMIFGLAHIHHLNEGIISHKRDSQSYLSALCEPRILVPALVRTVVQFSYTTLFGVFETFVLLRTGNLYVCILSHTFCNWLGLPRFWGRVGVLDIEDEDECPDTDTGSGKRDDDKVDAPIDASMRPAQSMARPAAPGQLGVQWTVAYYVLLVGGAIAFAKLLWPLTESERSLARF